MVTGLTIALPCHAQDSADIPVLKQYGGPDWIYFAKADDDALIFENLPNDGSNVLVAAERSAAGRRILANTEIWTDKLGRLHTTGVLKLQLEYNAFLKEQRSIWGPGRTGATVVDESGILDFKTLSIPFAKLEPRIRRITDRLDEDAAAERLATNDPAAAALTKAYAPFIREKASAAMERMDDLRIAIASVPRSENSEASPTSTTDGRQGLRGLEIPSEKWHFLRIVSQDSREIRFAAARPMLQDELFVTEFIDPTGMTPTIVGNLSEKAAAAEKAIVAAENICRELLTPPCP